MEKYFIVKEDSEYGKDLDKYIKIVKVQKNFVREFFKENNIEANEYIISGNGSVNKPFDENDKNEIKLEVIPTENDLNNFNNLFCKANERGLCQFKKRSKISKNFAQQCVDNKVPINLWSPRVSDYFESLSYGVYGCSYEQFKHNDKLYLKVESPYLKEDDTPKGFLDIKASEFYLAKEQHKNK